MRRSIETMQDHMFDVLVVGGGINGTGVARDAAMRGLTVAIIDKGDFGWGTTARSTRLAHGGLRYLEMFDFALVRESLRERELLLKNAPHLVRPIPFLTPVYRWSRVGRFKVNVGMWLYDLLSYDKSLPRYRWHSKADLVRLEPGLDGEGLVGGAQYYDAQIDLPERLCIENVQSAAEYGATVANYVEMISLKERSDLSYTEAEIRDVLTDRQLTVKARVVVNATGPWSDRLDIPGATKMLRTTKGAHLVVPRLTDHAIVMLAGEDGRLFFCIPWMGHSLIGTTDTDYDGDPGEAQADGDDVTYLIGETKRYFPRDAIDPVYTTMAGVRPLVRQRSGKVHESAVSRKHAIVDSAPGTSYGIVSVAGGKLTNFRQVAEEVTDRLCKKLGKGEPCQTRGTPMYGGRIRSFDETARSLRKEYDDVNLSDDVFHHLLQLYGSRSGDILQLCRHDPALTEPIGAHSPHIMAQVAYGIDREFVCTSADFMLRRTGIGFFGSMGRRAFQNVSRYLADRFQWDRRQRLGDEDDFEAHMNLLSTPGMSPSLEERR